MLSGSPQCLFLIAPSWFPNVYLSCVLCTLCCQVLRSVYFWLPLRGSLTFICPVYCVPYVVRFSAVLIFVAPSWFPNVYLSCVLCTLCCQVLRSVYFWLPLRGSLTFIFLCIVYPMLSGSPQCLFLIAPSWCNVYFSCVLCTLCCQVLRSVYF